MPTPDWTRTEDWDVLYLGGQRMPGVAHVDISYPSGLDIQKPKGAKKAKIRDMGTPPAELDITLEMLPEDLPALEKVVSTIRPRSVFGPREPMDITHPNARLWGVNVVKIAEVQSPTPKSGGSYTLKLKAIEWAPPTKVKKAKEKPKDGGAEDWNVEPLIDALRPSKQGAPQQNFSSPADNFSSGDIPGSGF